MSDTTQQGRTVPELEPVPTVIAAGVLVEGSVHGDGSLRVEGALAGEIQVTGDVMVTEQGAVKGPIAGDCVRIAGRVRGTVSARTQVRLEMSGCLQGDVTTPSFVIEDGGHFDGRSHMTQEGEEPVVLY